MANWMLRILETAEEMTAVEDLQRVVWPGSETDIVPTHLLVTMAHNGGMVIGAYAVDPETAKAYRGAFDPGPAEPEREAAEEEAAEGPGLMEGEPRVSGRFIVPPASSLIGCVFGFPGLYFTPDGPRSKHCSHMLGVHPDYRNSGVGFALKRAQWQMARHQGVDRITWTYDPLLSRNAQLNIARLGAVCSTYLVDEYGPMRDANNAGLFTDRFQVDWWVNTPRVIRRLSRRSRQPLDLAHYLSAGAEILNPTRLGTHGFPEPASDRLPDAAALPDGDAQSLILIEIPPDLNALKTADMGLALEWRLHTRLLFQALFTRGYLTTDFIHLPGSTPRSFYALTHGDSTL
jgi:predicted GNAT superfamily acetyltransferase